MLYHPRDWDWNQIGGKPLHYAFDPARASVGNLGERKKKKNQDSKEECGTQQEEADSRGLQEENALRSPAWLQTVTTTQLTVTGDTRSRADAARRKTAWEASEGELSVICWYHLGVEP